MRQTRIARHLAAPRAAVYAALVDPQSVAKWKAPAGMKAEVHEFEAREGGTIRVSLTYTDANGSGKTTAQTDTYHGRFLELIPDERVVEVDEFETLDPELQGEMWITIELADVDGGTDLIAVHEGVPPGISLDDNEVGWTEALTRLAALVEPSARPPVRK
jgi:uncharacterized protein YndB with AHSA1/START domain